MSMAMAMVNINYNKIFEIFENSIAISSNVAQVEYQF